MECLQFCLHLLPLRQVYGEEAFRDDFRGGIDGISIKLAPGGLPKGYKDPNAIPSQEIISKKCDRHATVSNDKDLPPCPRPKLRGTMEPQATPEFLLYPEKSFNGPRGIREPPCVPHVRHELQV
jgi:hypothetical protein